MADEIGQFQAGIRLDLGDLKVQVGALEPLLRAVEDRLAKVEGSSKSTSDALHSFAAEATFLNGALELAHKGLELFHGAFELLHRGLEGAIGIYEKTVEAAGKYADAMEQQSQMVGDSAAHFQALTVGMQIFTGGMGSATTALRFLGRNMETIAGGEALTAKEAMSRLGVSVLESGKYMKGSGDILDELAPKFAKMPDGPEKTAIAMALFGRAGATMIPLLNEIGKSGLTVTEYFKQFGLAMSGEVIESAAHFQHQVELVEQQLAMLPRVIGSAAIPAFQDLVVGFRDEMTQLLAWTNAHREQIHEVAKIIADGLHEAGADVLKFGQSFVQALPSVSDFKGMLVELHTELVATRAEFADWLDIINGLTLGVFPALVEVAKDFIRTLVNPEPWGQLISLVEVFAAAVKAALRDIVAIENFIVNATAKAWDDLRHGKIPAPSDTSELQAAFAKGGEEFEAALDNALKRFTSHAGDDIRKALKAGTEAPLITGDWWSENVAGKGPKPHGPPVHGNTKAAEDATKAIQEEIARLEEEKAELEGGIAAKTAAELASKKFAAATQEDKDKLTALSAALEREKQDLKDLSAALDALKTKNLATTDAKRTDDAAKRQAELQLEEAKATGDAEAIKRAEWQKSVVDFTRAQQEQIRANQELTRNLLAERAVLAGDDEARRSTQLQKIIEDNEQVRTLDVDLTASKAEQRAQQLKNALSVIDAEVTASQTANEAILADSARTLAAKQAQEEDAARKLHAVNIDILGELRTVTDDLFSGLIAGTSKWADVWKHAWQSAAKEAFKVLEEVALRYVLLGELKAPTFGAGDEDLGKAKSGLAGMFNSLFGKEEKPTVEQPGSGTPWTPAAPAVTRPGEPVGGTGADLYGLRSPMLPATGGPLPSIGGGPILAGGLPTKVDVVSVASTPLLPPNAGPMPSVGGMPDIGAGPMVKAGAMGPPAAAEKGAASPLGGGGAGMGAPIKVDDPKVQAATKDTANKVTAGAAVTGAVMLGVGHLVGGKVGKVLEVVGIGLELAAAANAIYGVIAAMTTTTATVVPMSIAMQTAILVEAILLNAALITAGGTKVLGTGATGGIAHLAGGTGTVRGGNAGRDSVLAMLMPGEGVVNVGAMKRNAGDGLVNYLNAGGSIADMIRGGDGASATDALGARIPERTRVDLARPIDPRVFNVSREPTAPAVPPNGPVATFHPGAIVINTQATDGEAIGRDLVEGVYRAWHR